MGTGVTVLIDRIPTEHEEQRELVRWFRQKYKGVRIFAIPNGGYRTRSTAAKLKAEGVMRGVPDLFIPAHNLWIEMKRSKGGVLSPEQRDWINYLEMLGNTVFVCHGADHAKDAVDKFFSNL
jgi:hypothetical protein